MILDMMSDSQTPSSSSGGGGGGGEKGGGCNTTSSPAVFPSLSMAGSSTSSGAPSNSIVTTTSSTTTTVRPDNLTGIRNFIGGSSYREVIESSVQYNNGIVNDRKMRLPYLDSQTGVAQSDCTLWMQRYDRVPGQTHGQLFSYPQRVWKKKRRQYLMNDEHSYNMLKKQQEEKIMSMAATASGVSSLGPREGPKGDHPEVTNGMGPSSGPSSSSGDRESKKEPSTGENEGKDFLIGENSKDGWYGDYDEADLGDGDDLEDGASDFDDFEEYGKKKKKKKTETPKRKRAEYSDAEKPFICEVCGVRYKTRPGLTYHFSHSHPEAAAAAAAEGLDKKSLEGDDSTSTPPPTGKIEGSSSSVPGPSAPSPQGKESQDSVSTEEDNGFSGNRPHGKGAVASPSNYCDFCLGDTGENKKTKSAEILVSCSDCGRSAHPSCLQFTDNMLESVKKYRWQCIECKSCGLCGTSDNDDQLLFCDDCDRGYHMYCLKPPIDEPPEGSWSCHLCIKEYHDGIAPPSQ